MSILELYNTLSRTQEPFTPQTPGAVDFYSCGPTVYNVVHIGNLRSFLAADTLYRWLTFGQKYTVRWVMNITDVDDKTIRDSQKAHPDLAPMEALTTFTRHYEEVFFENLATLNIPRASFFANPRATEYISQMQDLIQRIVENGIGYEKDGSIYFSIAEYGKKQKYGQLVSLDLTALKTGTRTLADEIEKENVQDFVLWKAHKEGEPSWDFELHGVNYPGRPGWHIECSAMSYALFKKLPFDIHSGGVDLQFPHHEDEIAQSTAGYGSAPVQYWVHNEHLLVEGKKMSKSLGNFYTLADLIKQGHQTDSIRFFLVTNHYRTKLNLSAESLRAAHEGLQKLRNTVLLLQKSAGAASDAEFSVDSYKMRFEQAMNDDLNTPNAIAVIYELSTAITAALGQFSATQKKDLLEFFQFSEKVFGVRFLPEEQAVPADVLALARERQKAKAAKDFATADKLRQAVEERGFTIRDTGDNFEILPRNL